MLDREPLRREPRQDRARRRIDAILEAAAAEFAEVGYEATTTNAIARRADTSIGSLYQFFPNKEAVLEALAARYEEQLRALHDQVLNEETARLPLPEMYDRVIHTLADFHAAHPGFRPLFYGSATSGRLAAAADRLHQECINRVEAMITHRFPELEPSRRRLYATINVEVVKTLLPLSESGDAALRRQVLEEIKRLLLAHMREALGAEASPRKTRKTRKESQRM
jgi:AcrR family transcriptional regulator